MRKIRTVPGSLLIHPDLGMDGLVPHRARLNLCWGNYVLPDRNRASVVLHLPAV